MTTGYHTVDTLARRTPEARYTSMTSTGVYFGTIADIRLAVEAKTTDVLHIEHFAKTAADEDFRHLLQRKADFARTIQDPRPILCEPKDIIFVTTGGKVLPRKTTA